ncbi:MAG TPA: hypothetical protein VE650_13180 [Acetobacteraceae bacterium]|nr:hypothetical protein [Acetobacteraceae bacterium]
MKRHLIPAFAAAVLAAGGAWLAATPAAAQSYYGQDQDNYQNRNYNQNRTYSQNRNYRNRNYNRDEPTASGDPWLNENDFDYNQRHWLPPRNDRYGNSDRDRNRYGENRGREYDQRYGRYDPDDNRNQYGLGRDYRPDYRDYDEDEQ